MECGEHCARLPGNFTYDGNGNILSVLRVGATAGVTDSLAYQYNRNIPGRLLNNKLNYLNGTGAASNFGPNQSANNYTYDPIGNLTNDNQAGVSNIRWTVYGKIDTLNSNSGTIAYTYDPAGQRATKTVGGVTTFYIRDAQGNTLALYDNKSNQVNWREQHLYGSGRIGMWMPNVNLANNNAVAVWDTLGHKQYELNNHLGNVLATVSDIRIPVSTDGITTSYYLPDVTTAQDYYGFGGLMPGRSFTENSVYRYGFNGKENDNEVKGLGNQQDYGMRIYDGRVGRFLSVDPIAGQYPWYTPYQFAGNSPVANIDKDGGEPQPVNPGTTEGQTTTTYDTKYSGGGEAYPVSQTWEWYSGNIKGHGPPGWFTEDQYKLIRQDWEHGQVMLPFDKSFFGDDPYGSTGGDMPHEGYGRNWNGYQVGTDGYLTGKKYAGSNSIFAGFNLLEWVDGAGELRVLGALSEGRALLKEGEYMIYLE